MNTLSSGSLVIFDLDHVCFAVERKRLLDTVNFEIEVSKVESESRKRSCGGEEEEEEEG